VAANGNHQAEDFNGDTAEDEGSTQGWSREEHERGDGEKETGWHHEQSRVFHLLSLSRSILMYARTPDRNYLPGSASRGVLLLRFAERKVIMDSNASDCAGRVCQI
jgi:hypothetical protein